MSGGVFTLSFIMIVGFLGVLIGLYYLVVGCIQELKKNKLW